MKYTVWFEPEPVAIPVFVEAENEKKAREKAWEEMSGYNSEWEVHSVKKGHDGEGI